MMLRSHFTFSLKLAFASLLTCACKSRDPNQASTPKVDLTNAVERATQGNILFYDLTPGKTPQTTADCMAVVVAEPDSSIASHVTLATARHCLGDKNFSGPLYLRLAGNDGESGESVEVRPLHQCANDLYFESKASTPSSLDLVFLKIPRPAALQALKGLPIRSLSKAELGEASAQDKLQLYGQAQATAQTLRSLYAGKVRLAIRPESVSRPASSVLMTEVNNADKDPHFTAGDSGSALTIVRGEGSASTEELVGIGISRDGCKKRRNYFLNLSSRSSQALYDQYLAERDSGKQSCDQTPLQTHFQEVVWCEAEDIGAGIINYSVIPSSQFPYLKQVPSLNDEGGCNLSGLSYGGHDFLAIASHCANDPIAFISERCACKPVSFGKGSMALTIGKLAPASARNSRSTDLPEMLPIATTFDDSGYLSMFACIPPEDETPSACFGWDDTEAYESIDWESEPLMGLRKHHFSTDPAHSGGVIFQPDPKMGPQGICIHVGQESGSNRCVDLKLAIETKFPETKPKDE